MINFEGNFLDCHLVSIFRLVFAQTDNILIGKKTFYITEVCRQRYRNMQTRGIFEKSNPVWLEGL